MSCFWHHKWNKWSKPEFKDIVLRDYYGETTHVRRKAQDRTCEKCGKYQWRMVD